jgi:hypothetical protein
LPANFLFWNQQGTDTGSSLFAGKARSYSNEAVDNEVARTAALCNRVHFR